MVPLALNKKVIIRSASGARERAPEEFGTKRLFQNPILASAGCTAALLRRSDLSYSPHTSSSSLLAAPKLAATPPEGGFVAPSLVASHRGRSLALGPTDAILLDA